jgi:hypothetical protein
MQRIVWTAAAAVAVISLTATALLWPKQSAQAQIGLPVGVADCACTQGTTLPSDTARVRVHVCQCGAQQCVITVGTRGSESGAGPTLELMQSCR